jgi:hypothetical protein
MCHRSLLFVPFYKIVRQESDRCSCYHKDKRAEGTGRHKVTINVESCARQSRVRGERMNYLERLAAA